MKQPKQKTPSVMSARKAAKNELKARLLTTLKNVLEQDKIKLTKKIKKQSKKLVKAVANELAIVKTAVAPKAAKEVKAAVAPKAVKAKPAPKVVDAKAEPAAPAKKAAPKATTPVKAIPAKASVAKPAAKSKTEKK